LYLIQNLKYKERFLRSLINRNPCNHTECDRLKATLAIAKLIGVETDELRASVEGNRRKAKQHLFQYHLSLTDLIELNRTETYYLW